MNIWRIPLTNFYKTVNILLSLNFRNVNHNHRSIYQSSFLKEKSNDLSDMQIFK